MLDPDVTVRFDGGPDRPALTALVRGAAAVSRRAVMFAHPSRLVHPALVNGAAGVVVTADGTPLSVWGFTVADGRIVAIDVLGDPDRLAGLDLSGFGG